MNSIPQAPAIQTESIRDELFKLLSPETALKIGHRAFIQTHSDEHRMAYVGKVVELSDIPAGIKALAAHLEEFVTKYDVVGSLLNGFIRYDLNVYDLRAPRTMLLGYIALTPESYALYEATMPLAQFQKEIA
jgi:hypothetical protein